MSPRVLFVSKPIAPPFHDGTKCLVRDIASHLERVRPVVMSTRGAPEARELGICSEHVELERVYASAGRFHPAFTANLRAAAWLALRSRADLWHFVFAPNPRSSRVGRALSRARRVPVLQTVASPPRRFEHVSRILFGQTVVCQSSWTRAQIDCAYEREGVSLAARPRLEVVPPPVDPGLSREPARVAAARQALGIPLEAPLFVYPGDLEVSQGAATVAELVPELARRIPGSVTVFAYRAKTPRAPALAAELARRLPREAARITGEMPDVLALIAGATAVLFPVDDLFGKVDLPIVLLEAMVLGVPVIALDHGPLRDLSGSVRVPLGDRSALLEAAVRLASEPSWAEQVVVEQRRAVQSSFCASAVAARYEQLYLDLLAARCPARV